MAPKLTRSTWLGIGITMAVLATLGVTYLLVLRPKLQLRRTLEADLGEVQRKLDELKVDFAGLSNPQTELTLLEQEVEIYQAAVTALDKIGAARLPADTVPEAMISGDDKDLIMLRFQESIDETVDQVEERVEEQFRKARVTLDRDVAFDYPNDLRDPEKAIEQGIERKGTVLVFEDVCNLLLAAEPYALRQAIYRDAEHSGDVYTFEYRLAMEMSSKSLLRLFYLMREGDAYYYVKELNVEPKNDRRTDSYFGTEEEMDNQRVEMVLAAPRTFSLVERDLEAEAAAEAERQRAHEEAQENSAWGALIRQRDRGDTEVFEQGKKWWQFWK